MRLPLNWLLLFVITTCSYAGVHSTNDHDSLTDNFGTGERTEISEALEDNQKRNAWSEFKQNGDPGYDDSNNDNQEEYNKRASWLEFKRNYGLGEKRASWLEFKRAQDKRASWLEFKRNHDLADLSDDKRASWLEFKRDGDKRASWLEFKRNSDNLGSWNNDKRASWLEFKRNLAMDGEKRASWLNFKRAVNSWSEAQKKNKGPSHTIDPETLKVIREMILKLGYDIKPSVLQELLKSSVAKSSPK